MSSFLHHCTVSNLSAIKSFKPKTSSQRDSPRLTRNLVRCESTTELSVENRQVKVSQGNDSLELCRILNGMWQTSGGWGTIDRSNAVEAMLRYADAGLTTFDMADHCNCFFSRCSYFRFCPSNFMVII